MTGQPEWIESEGTAAELAGLWGDRSSEELKRWLQDAERQAALMQSRAYRLARELARRGDL